MVQSPAELSDKEQDSDPVYDRKGHIPDRGGLRKLEAGGQTSPPTGKLHGVPSDGQAAKDSAKNPGRHLQAVPDPGDSFYTETPKLSARGLRHLFLGTRRRKAATGGGITTIVGIVFLFFFASGPLEFVHLAQLMQRFHFQSHQDQSDDRFLQEARYVRYKMKGEAYKANLGFFQNKIAKAVETKMASVGFEPAYNNSLYGVNLDGWVLDPQKLSASFGDLQGKSPPEIKQYFKDNFPDVKISELPDGRFFADFSKINSSLFGHRTLIKFSKIGLESSGYRNVAGSLTARILGKRAGSTWHPITREKGIQLSKLSTFLASWFESTEKGTTSSIITEEQVAKNDKAAQAAAKSVEGQSDSVIGEGEQTQTKLAAGDPAAVDSYKASIQARLTGSALLIAGVACVLSGLDQQSGQIKEAQVVLPLVREANNIIGLGNQVMSTNDFSLAQLAQYKALLDGPSTQNGNSKANTSWIEAQSIQTELGNPNTGIAPSQTLTTINQTSPFHFLNSGATGTIVGAVCSKVGQGVQLIIGFFGGDIESLVAGGIAQAILAPKILSEAANWLAGSALNPLAQGADFGNNIDFGAALSANAQAVTSGGRALSSSESNQLALYENQQSEQDFQSHSLAYRILNPYDQRSAISTLIDQQSPSLGNSASKVASAVFNIGHIFSSFSSLFSARAHAAAVTTYDYGFPQYGFSVDEMNNPAVTNPYKNAEDVVNTILPANPDYIGRVQDCFGVTIDPNTYEITSYGTDPIDPNHPDTSKQNFYSNATTDCGDTSTSWLQVRFYVFDSQTMEGMACYIGDGNDADIQKACTDVGFDSQSSASTTPTGGGSNDSLTNPFPGGWTPNRLDQGYDGTFTGKIVAPFSGTVIYAGSNVPTWGGYIDIKANSKLSNLPTSTLYFAEGLAPLVKVGDHVSAGDPIASAAPSPYGNAYGSTIDGSGQIEWGVASDSAVGTYSLPYAQALGGGECSKGQNTPQAKAMVLNFASWAEQVFGLGSPTTVTDAGCG